MAEFFAKEKPEFVFLATAKVGWTLANDAYPADFIRENLVMEKNIIESSRAELDTQIGDLLPNWSIAAIVTALQALRGVASVIAIALVAEIGNFRRFPSARDLRAYFGLVPGEHSIGCTVRSRGITKQGNSATRVLLYEAAWCYRQSAKIGQWMKARMPIDVPQFAQDISKRSVLAGCTRLGFGLTMSGWLSLN